MKSTVVKLEEARRREREQTRFYRALAAEAESAGRGEDSERLNGLHADEQHHLSRITARLLELGADPAPLPAGSGELPRLSAWEETARKREAAEVAFYHELAGDEGLDPETRAVVQEILDSERNHLEHLGGKWMPA